MYIMATMVKGCPILLVMLTSWEDLHVESFWFSDRRAQGFGGPDPWEILIKRHGEGGGGAPGILNFHVQ